MKEKINMFQHGTFMFIMISLMVGVVLLVLSAVFGMKSMITPDHNTSQLVARSMPECDAIDNATQAVICDKLSKDFDEPKAIWIINRSIVVDDIEGFLNEEERPAVISSGMARISYLEGL